MLDNVLLVAEVTQNEICGEDGQVGGEDMRREKNIFKIIDI